MIPQAEVQEDIGNRALSALRELDKKIHSYGNQVYETLGEAHPLNSVVKFIWQEVTGSRVSLMAQTDLMRTIEESESINGSHARLAEAGLNRGAQHSIARAMQELSEMLPKFQKDLHQHSELKRAGESLITELRAMSADAQWPVTALESAASERHSIPKTRLRQERQEAALLYDAAWGPQERVID